MVWHTLRPADVRDTDQEDMRDAGKDRSDRVRSSQGEAFADRVVAVLNDGSLAQGGEGVGAMWGQEKTLDYLDRAGFRSVEVNELAHDIQNNW